MERKKKEMSSKADMVFLVTIADSYNGCYKRVVFETLEKAIDGTKKLLQFKDTTTSATIYRCPFEKDCERMQTIWGTEKVENPWN